MADALSPVRMRLALACATGTRTPVRFAARELLAPVLPRRRGAVRSYARRSGRCFCVRHGTQDLGVLVEVLIDELYRLPAEVRALLPAARPPRILDLGSHVGLFGVAMLEQLPGAEIHGLEPDPANHAVLQRTVAANETGGAWRVEQACAGTMDGVTRFAAAGHSSSRVADAGDHLGTIEVPTVDVPARLPGADLVKIDIEGSEWSLLDDERFPAAAPPVLVLEYHPHQCPEATPREAAERRLHRLGYATRAVSHDAALGIGTVWAWRAGA